MSDRSVRHAIIRRLLKSHVVGSQEQLVKLLEAEGVTCTQATLSRDLRDMGVTRVRGLNGPRYRLDKTAHYMKALREVVGMEILDVRHNGQLIVLRTLQGRAEGVAGYLDARAHPDVLGTVAGDDTVFVAPTDPARITELVRAIQSLADGEKEQP